MEKQLTQSQLLLWMGQQLNPKAPLYNMAFLFDLRGKFEQKAFQMAFAKLVEQNDTMRTVFHLTDGKPQQLLPEVFHYSLPVLDWRKEPPGEIELQKWAAQRSQELLDLEQCCFDSVLIQLEEHRHLWYLNQHHLITDAWSVTVLYQAVMEYYQLALQGTLAQAVVPPQFANYVDFETLQRANAKTAEHWSNKEYPSSLPRLYGFRRPEAGSQAYRIAIPFTLERAEQLRALTTRKELRSWTPHATLFNIFLTTLFAYLFRASGQRSLCIGSPAHNRTKPAFKETLGVFIELFPLVVEIQDRETFLSLYKKVQTEVNSFLMNGRPGASSAETSRAFGTVLNYIHTSFPPIEGLEVKSHWIHPGHCDPRHHLRMLVYDFDQTGEMQLYFELNADVFDETLRQQAPVHYLSILDAFLQNQEQLLTTPSLIGAAEQDLWLKKLNTAVVAANGQLMVQQFEEQVAQTPQQIAIRCADQELSYQELNLKANQLAAHLQQVGLGVRQRVAIYLKRSPELLIAIWGALKAGVAYVPISFDSPVDRRYELLQLADCQLVLTTLDHSQGTFANYSTTVLDSDQEIWNSAKVENPPAVANREDLAYLMFTSGSTGQPKGVMISHAALTNYIDYAREKYTAPNQSTFALFTRIGFDLTVTSIFTPFTCGGQIVIYPEQDTGPDLAVLDVMRDNAVDIIKLTPSHLELLRADDWSSSRIRLMIVGGEDFKSSLAQAITAAFPAELQIYNEYGPTEATVGCVVHHYESRDLDTGSVPIGRPTTGMEAYVLDEHRHLAPVGIVGELFVAGKGLAEGYWKDETRTQECFVTHAFQAGQKMYRTGDLARLNTAGELEFVGRTDQQIKIGGIRIELGEIEAQLAHYAGVEGVAVELLEQLPSVADESKSIKRILVAFYSGDQAVDVMALRAYLSKVLPVYMIPSQFQYLPALPLTPNGKINRQALRAMERENQSLQSYVAPGTQVEELLADMWQEILQVDQVGIYDEFLAVGGTSLSAIRLMARINEILELDLPLSMIFQEPTVAQFAARVEEILAKLLSDLEDQNSAE
ncbi:MAG: amino acid adenylation domain-containing protein [Bacteroidota bacterium]